MSLSRWLNVRPHEVRPVALLFGSAFLMLAFSVLARSLRESIYITVFPVETLPYITAAVALLSVPVVGVFARQLARHDPRRVLVTVVLVLSFGIALLSSIAIGVAPASVAFYLWTDLGTLVLTSGFWVMTAEYFPVRGAKRLFGVIGAGGTAGYMVMGNATAWLEARLGFALLIPGLVVILALFLLTQLLLPALERTRERGDDRAGSRSAVREGLTLVWRTPHLRTIAAIVASATIASTLIDYQFKELAVTSLTTREQLVGFFGAFYGWTGALSLVIQLLLAARIMASSGIAVSIAVLPSVLLLGAAGLFVLPSLLVATLVRGADNSLRKSLHRSVLEVLYVPLPSALRRKTKTLIDSVVDAMAGGFGSAIVFLWVTLSGLPSRYLSLFALVVLGYFIYQSLRMGKLYRQTISHQLVEGGTPGEGIARLDQSLLMTATFSQIDLQSALAEMRTDAASVPGEVRAAEAIGPEGPPGFYAGSTAASADVLQRLASSSPAEVVQAMQEIDVWTEAHVPALLRLLARDALSRRAIAVLSDMQDIPTPYLASELANEAGDFVIRRRIPRVFARAGGQDADAALLGALTANRFEIRYRAASALMSRRQADLPTADVDRGEILWRAVRAELGRERPVWELQRLLDTWDKDDDSVSGRAQHRGALSLKHTFRLLSLVLDPDAVRAAYQGIESNDERLLGLALEYLEQVLPDDVRERLWPFIGDLTERQRARAIRSLDQVVDDLVKTEATLFQTAEEREALRRLLEDDS